MAGQYPPHGMPPLPPGYAGMGYPGRHIIFQNRTILDHDDQMDVHAASISWVRLLIGMIVQIV